MVDHIKPVGQFMQISTSKKNEETATAAEKLPTAVDEIAQAAAGAKKVSPFHGIFGIDTDEDFKYVVAMFFLEMGELWLQ